MIILHFFKFHRWKIIFVGHEEKACFAAYPNLENKSQKYAKSRDFWKNKESLGCTRSISCGLVGKIVRSIGNVCKLGEKCRWQVHYRECRRQEPWRWVWGISSPRKVKNLEANNLAVCIYLQIFQPLIWTERIAVYSTNWVVRQIPKQYRINQSISQSVNII